MSAAGMGYFYGLGSDVQALRNQLALAKSHLSMVRGTPVSWSANFRGVKRGGMSSRDRAHIQVTMQSNYAQVATGQRIRAPRTHNALSSNASAAPPAPLVNTAKKAIDTAEHNVKAIEEQIKEAEKQASTSLLPAATPEEQAKQQVDAQWEAEMREAEEERQKRLTEAQAVLNNQRPVGPTSVNEVLKPGGEATTDEPSKLPVLLLLGGAGVAAFLLLRN